MLIKPIEKFSLGHIPTYRDDLLSGGKRRRTEIVRGLATNLSFILLDESFAGIDPVALENIQRIVAKLTEKALASLLPVIINKKHSP